MEFHIPPGTDPMEQPKELEENIKIHSEVMCTTCYTVGREGEDGSWWFPDAFFASCIMWARISLGLLLSEVQHLASSPGSLSSGLKESSAWGVVFLKMTSAFMPTGKSILLWMHLFGRDRYSILPLPPEEHPPNCSAQQPFVIFRLSEDIPVLALQPTPSNQKQSKDLHAPSCKGRQCGPNIQLKWLDDWLLIERGEPRNAALTQPRKAKEIY